VKFAILRVGNERFVAAVAPESGLYRPLADAAGRPLQTMVQVIESYDAIRRELDRQEDWRSLEGAAFAAPILPPRNVMCVGKNYHDHAHEFTRSGFDSSAKDASEAIPHAPIIFTKAPETTIGSGEDILYPTGISDAIDYEAELAVVIGKGGRGIAKADALDHVFGYAILNDVTARDLQAKHKQWFIGKSLDTFCPLGPWIATADEVDVSNLQVQCWVNGELRQNANTADLIFDVPTIIETLSQGLTLRPGDVIATGTPAGVGIGFNPPKYLLPGDEVAIEITGLGRLVNRLA
jgi:2-keto-4-pentenoate hydratase/2-oxohepta-3-ene-1,7-dioic acid hydratase in catechol pathway